MSSFRAVAGKILISLMVAAFAGSGPAGLSAVAQDVPTYRVRPGDTLYSIAREHALSVDELLRYNDLDDETLKAGQILYLADRNAAGGQEAVSGNQGKNPELANSLWEVVRTDGPTAHVVVGAGTTLYELSARFAVDPDTLLQLNPDMQDPLSAGARVSVPADRVDTLVEVRPGDTLYSLSREYGVSVDRIRVANELSTTTLAVGQRLRIPSEAVPAGTGQAIQPVREVISAIVYPSSYVGRRTVDGRRYDPTAYSVSHPDLPIGSIVMLSSSSSETPTFAIVSDRGASKDLRLMDVSEAVRSALNIPPDSSARIELRLID